MTNWAEANFGWFVLIGVTLFTALGISVLLAFRAIFRKLDRGQEEMDRELKQEGFR